MDLVLHIMWNVLLDVPCTSSVSRWKNLKLKHWQPWMWKTPGSLEFSNIEHDKIAQINTLNMRGKKKNPNVILYVVIQLSITFAVLMIQTE